MDWSIVWQLLAAIFVITGIIFTVIPPLPGSVMVLGGMTNDRYSNQREEQQYSHQDNQETEAGFRERFDQSVSGQTVLRQRGKTLKSVRELQAKKCQRLDDDCGDKAKDEK